MSYLPTREAVFFRGQRGEHHQVVFEKSHAVKRDRRDQMRPTQILRVYSGALPARGTMALVAMRLRWLPGLPTRVSCGSPIA